MVEEEEEQEEDLAVNQNGTKLRGERPEFDPGEKTEKVWTLK